MSVQIGHVHSRGRMKRAGLVGATPWALGCLGLLLSLACAGQKRPLSLSAPTASLAPSDYTGVLKTWTRSTRLNTLEEMDNVLTVTSTYYSAEFRAAYLAKYESDFQLTSKESRALEAEHQTLHQAQHEFYVALYGQRPDYGKLDDPERTAWQVHLVDSEGRVYKPARVERIVRPSVLERTYFPYTSDFRTVFRLVFDKTGESAAVLGKDVKWFGLRFSGPQGAAFLRWYVG